MIRFVALLCVVAVPARAASWSPGLKVRFDVTGIGSTAFMDLPQSPTEAIQDDWISVERPTSPPGLESLKLWCPRSDYAVCILVDDTEYIAGLQIALDIDNYSDSILDWQTLGFTKWTTTVEGETKNFWTAHQYFISASTLATDPVTRIANRNENTILQDGNIWVSGFNGKLANISTTVSDFTNDESIFTKQACIPMMGDHYYYNMYEGLACRSDTMFPWFPLVQSNQLIGLGFVSFGKITIPEEKTDWFETPNRRAVEVIVPRGPQCLYELAESAGMVTMHTYFIRHPYLVNCIIQK